MSQKTRIAILGGAVAGGGLLLTLRPQEEEVAPAFVAANIDVARRQRAEKQAREEAAKNQESAEDAVTIEETVAKAPEPPEEEALEETEPPLTFAKKVEWRIAFLQAEIIRLEEKLKGLPMESDMHDRCILLDYRNELQLWWNGQESPQTEEQLDEWRASLNTY